MGRKRNSVKYFFSIILSLVMLLSAAPLTDFSVIDFKANAVNADLHKGITLTYEKAGNSVLVKIINNDSAGFGAADIDLIYDSAEMVFESLEWSDYIESESSSRKGLAVFNSSENGKVKIGLAHENSFAGDCEIAEITLGIADSTKVFTDISLDVNGNKTEYAIDLSEGAVESTGSIDASYEFNNGYVTVILSNAGISDLGSVNIDIIYDKSVLSYDSFLWSEYITGSKDCEYSYNPGSEYGVSLGFYHLNNFSASSFDVARVKFRVTDTNADTTDITVKIRGKALNKFSYDKKLSAELACRHKDSNSDNICDVCSEMLNVKMQLKLELLENTPSYTVFAVVAENAAKLTNCDLEINYNTGVFKSCEYANTGTELYAMTNNGSALAHANISLQGKIKVGIAFRNDFGINKKVELYTVKLIKSNAITESTIVMSSQTGNSELVVPAAHTHAYSSEITTAATCAKEGVKTFTCSCGDMYTESIAKLTTHTWGKWTVTKAATYEAEGKEERSCSVCKKTETRATAKLEYTEIIFADTEEMKSTGENNIFSVDGKTVNDILKNTKGNISVTDKDGKAVKTTDTVKSGMVISLKDSKGKVIDTKTIIVPGDNNGDGKTTAADARLALRASVALEKLSIWQSDASDTVEIKENKITAADARFILRASVNLESFRDWMKTV